MSIFGKFGFSCILRNTTYLMLFLHCTSQNELIEDRSRRTLPAEGTNWTTIRAMDSIYVDKTIFVKKLMEMTDNMFLLTRPSQFGKSTFINMAADVFRGNDNMFQGLKISEFGNVGLLRKHGITLPKNHSIWITYPVIELNFAHFTPFTSVDEFKLRLNSKLQDIADKSIKPIRDFNATCHGIGCFTILLHAAFNFPVVVFVDEYDKPFHHALFEVKNNKLVEDIKHYLDSFFEELKNSRKTVALVFLTGITKLDLNSVESGTNCVVDLTHSPIMAEAFGITAEEIRVNFQFHLEQYARTTLQGNPTSEQLKIAVKKVCSELKFWYEGYQFDKSLHASKVYNPVSAMKSLTRKNCESYWSSTDSMEYLVSQLYRESCLFSQLKEGFKMFPEELRIRDDPMCFPPLLKRWMLMYGYLTISYYNNASKNYVLKIPNHEIEVAISNNLAGYDYYNSSYFKSSRVNDLKSIKNSLANGNIKVAMNILKTFRFKPFIQLVNALDGKVSPEEASRRLSILFPIADISVKTDFKFKKDTDPKNDGGDVDLLTKNLPINYVMQIECSATKTAVHAVNQLINHLSNHPMSFKNAIGNPDKLYFVGLQFKMVMVNDYDGCITLDSWICILYEKGHLKFESAQFSSQEMERKFYESRSNEPKYTSVSTK